MNSVRSLKNQYRGVNPHLHSQWQTKGGWNNFHNRHIGDLTGLLRQQLLPLGYTAASEQSLQIQRLGETREPQADLLISDTPDSFRLSPPRMTSAGVTFPELSVADLIEADEEVAPYVTPCTDNPRFNPPLFCATMVMFNQPCINEATTRRISS